MAELIITAVGSDRPGLVGDLTGLLYRRGANLADSRMVNLRGNFAILMLVEAAESVIGELKGSLPSEAQKLGLSLTFGGGSAANRMQGVPYRLKTYSPDQPGIVHRVSKLLQEKGVNIEDLHTEVESAPFTGTALFTLEAHLTVPTKVPVKSLRQELEKIADELNCDFDLEPA